MPTFIGLDCETTGANIDDGASLIQVGAATFDSTGVTDVYRSLVNPGHLRWSHEAFAVHGIPADDVRAARPHSTVDAEAAAWLTQRTGAARGTRSLIAVGFNVGAFDFRFLNRWMPDTMSLFTHRCVDLNSLCFALDSTAPADSESEWTWTQWKAAAKTYAREQLQAADVHGGAHDAGWDAAEAVLCFTWLRKAMLATHTAECSGGYLHT